MAKLFEGNPRRISKKRYNDLIASLDELGDISGIVHDLNSDQIIGGNQRSTVFDVATMQPVITEQLEAPNKQGTIARGYVEWHGERFAYRAVRWTPEQCSKGNIKANIQAGAWDWDTLAGWDAARLQSWGFDAETLATWNSDAGNLRQMINADLPPNDIEAEWEGMPEFEQEDKTAWKSITVHFDSPDNLQNFAELVGQTITEKTKSIWYPKKEREDLTQFVAHEQS